MIAEIEILKLFILVMVRFSGLIITAPVLSSNNFPVLGKLGLIGMAAYVVTPTLAALPAPLPADPIPFALTGAGELLIGMAIGLVMQMVFASIQIAGQVLDMQSGFGLVNVFNPALETQVPLFGFLFFILAVLFLLATFGHHLMIRALVSTFERIPVGGFAPETPVMGQVAAWGGLMFHDAVLMAAPVAGAMMLAYLTMGIMGRAVPQLNLFVIGFPLTIAASLLVAALSIGYYLELIDQMFTGMFHQVDRLIDGLG
jgi:flagellar biosynthetic protein FliR